MVNESPLIPTPGMSGAPRRFVEMSQSANRNFARFVGFQNMSSIAVQLIEEERKA
jgi:hypothetical protein